MVKRGMGQCWSRERKDSCLAGILFLAVGTGKGGRIERGRWRVGLE